jgi:hypothetical protein
LTGGLRVTADSSAAGHSNQAGHLGGPLEAEPEVGLNRRMSVSSEGRDRVGSRPSPLW